VIIVTGTKRSGTSMWMQILRGAGIEIVGLAFPKDWGTVIRDANLEGFYESPLRAGINFQTNPHPLTGVYLAPEVCRHMAVKVFIPGVIRSDLAFIDKVVASIRDWREYHTSLERLYAMEQENRPSRPGAPDLETRYLTPTYEWWRENFGLLRDYITRRYPIHMVAYESVLKDPARIVGETLDWLGAGELEGALKAIRPDLKTQDSRHLGEVPGIPPDVSEVLDELYRRVRDRQAIDVPFIERLNGTDDLLRPKIREELRRLRAERPQAPPASDS
jgi:hypothetical protein